MEKQKWLSKIIIQIVFIIILISMFYIDKVLHLVSPPLQDTWYALVFIFAVGVEPHIILDFLKTLKWK